VVEAVTVPVIASGGAGSSEHVADALDRGGAEAALVAGIVHDGTTTVGQIKLSLSKRGIPVRQVA
jgi:cyclase